MEKIRKGIAEKALHNKIMEKEVVFHKEKAAELSEAIEVLKNEISHLRQAIHEDRQKRKVMPMAAVRCLPDSEVQLDIPLLKRP